MENLTFTPGDKVKLLKYYFCEEAKIGFEAGELGRIINYDGCLYTVKMIDSGVEIVVGGSYISKVPGETKPETLGVTIQLILGQHSFDLVVRPIL